MRFALLTLLLAQSALAATTVPLQLTYADVGITSLCGSNVGAESIVNESYGSSGISSFDGTTVTVLYKGEQVCGHSGRGGSITYKYWCVEAAWDIGGNLLSVTPLEPATAYGNSLCPIPNPSTRITVGDYTALTLVTRSVYGQTFYTPEIVTP